MVIMASKFGSGRADSIRDIWGGGRPREAGRELHSEADFNNVIPFVNRGGVEQVGERRGLVDGSIVTIHRHGNPEFSPEGTTQWIQVSRWSAGAEVRVRPPVELLTNAQARAIGGGWRVASLVDLETGKRFSIAWHPPGLHTDWSPMSPADVRIIQEILSPERVDEIDWDLAGSWSWNARPGVLEVDGRRIAVGFHLFPHGSILGSEIGAEPGLPLRAMSDTQATWTIGGHMCMYYSNSTSLRGTQEYQNAMNDAARRAYNWSR